MFIQEHPIPGMQQSPHQIQSIPMVARTVPPGGVGHGFGRLFDVLRELAHPFYIVHPQVTEAIRRHSRKKHSEEVSVLETGDLFSAAHTGTK